MDDDNRPDRIGLSEPPEFPADQHHERTGSMSLGAGPNANGDEVSPINGDSVPTSAAPPAQIDPTAKAVQDVITSEVSAARGLSQLR
jgi:hypothetical protein